MRNVWSNENRRWNIYRNTWQRRYRRFRRKNIKFSGRSIKKTEFSSTESIEFQTDWFCTRSRVRKDRLRCLRAIHYITSVWFLQQFAGNCQRFGIHSLCSEHSANYRSHPTSVRITERIFRLFLESIRRRCGYFHDNSWVNFRSTEKKTFCRNNKPFFPPRSRIRYQRYRREIFRFRFPASSGADFPLQWTDCVILDHSAALRKNNNKNVENRLDAVSVSVFSNLCLCIDRHGTVQKYQNRIRFGGHCQFRNIWTKSYIADSGEKQPLERLTVEEA